MLKFLEKSVPITSQQWGEDIVPLVSIDCTTYNHENFIRDAIEGFLMQKTTFPVEILIHDDASTDKTASIVREYEEKYPHLIKPIYQTENQYSKRDGTIGRIQRGRARGKYIALCEGDDYWTDPLKLQKQVEFLEGNEEYSMCFHNALVDYEDKSKNRFFNKIRRSKEISLKMIIGEWIIPTASIVFRHEMIEMPDWASKIYSGDMTLALMAAKNGKLFYFNDNMSVYRKRFDNESVSAMMINRKRYIKLQYVKILEYYNIETDFVYFNELHNEINYNLLSLKVEEKKIKRKIIFILFDYFRYIAWKVLKKIYRTVSYL